MAIPILCTCGRHLQVPDDVAGKEFRCPYCEHFVYIPTADEDRALFRWYCECGQRLKARRVSAGRAINCPRCGQRCIVPSPQPKTDEETEGTPAVLLEEDAANPTAEEAMTCSQCGKQFTTDQEKCPECGAPLLDEDEEAAQSETRIIREQVYTEDEDDDESRVRDLLDASAGAEAESESSVFPSGRPASVAPAAAAAVEEGFGEEEVSLEGLTATNLSVFFKTTGGMEAALAAGRQAPNSLGLYLAYAGFVVVFASLYVLTGGQGVQPPVWRWTLFGLLGVASVALAAGFVGCIRDSLFQRRIGIERILYDAILCLPAFLLALLVTAPLWAGAAYGAVVAFRLIWSMSADFLVKALLSAGLLAALALLFELLALTPVLAILEKVSPFEALAHAFRFAKRHILPLIAMSFTLFPIGGGVIGIALLIRDLAAPHLEGWPPFAAKTLVELVGAFLAAGIVGQCIASLMLLYASHIGDEDDLQRFHTHCAGPGARRWLLWVSILLLCAVAIVLSYYRANAGENAVAVRRAGAGFRTTLP